MKIHFLVPEDRSKWPPIWNKCFDIWAQTRYNLNIWTDEGVNKLLQEDDNKFYEEYLNKLAPIYKWDYVRYIILQKYRGAYFDMDVELVDESFLKKLNPDKIYIKEGDAGSYLENSIMISQSPFFDTMWERVKIYTKNLLMDNFELAKTDPNYTMKLVGPDALAKFITTYVRGKEIDQNTKLFEILSHEHFGSLTNEISFTRHYMTSVWSNS
jgi:mannosyltransferase OCH1-like enzyme